MKRGTATFLQIVIVFIGSGVLAFMLWEPHLEGRNVNATLSEIYLKDPFLAYVYLASIPFFVGVYQASKVLGYAKQNTMLSPATLKSVRTIKYCAAITVGAIVAAIVFLLVAARNTNEDAAGAVALGLIATVIFMAITAAATLLERTMKKHSTLY